MVDSSRVSTRDVAVTGRPALVRDTAFNLFNLEVEFQELPAPSIWADIQVARSPLGGVTHVATSRSIVSRTKARAKAATTGNLLVYFIHHGGSSFENHRGQQFTTSSGSVVVGSQDRAYKSAAHAGHEWNFHAMSVPEHLFSLSASHIRSGGFQLVPGQTSLTGLLASFVGRLCQDFPTMDAPSISASWKALDSLVAAALGAGPGDEGDLAGTIAGERLRMAQRFLEDNYRSPSLSAGKVAAHLCVSSRQMHRAFETAGKTLSAELRRIRVERAAALLQRSPSMPVTEVAFACGFDSLATFYRCFKTEYQVTASDFRAGLFD